ncbi:GLPGLI family protein [Polaribacter sp. Asnod1-A03]|uniref:GLPGLI family protein n=1 Tax=Polaribacter sp. Asnod1-A03 TaxID=3160581 RepID=UPI00386F49F2
MKNLLTLIICCFSITVFSQKISGKVTYVVSMESFSKEKIDSISKKLKSKKVKMDKWMRDVFENTPNVNAYLEFSNDESLYYVEDKMQNDGKPIFNVNRTFAGGDNRYYKNTKTNEYFNESSTFGELFLIEINAKKWKITQESKKIGRYLCFKAIDIESTNKKMKPVVWFTPELPVSFGPLKYNGLPGLVLLVELSKRTISASEIIINPKKEIVIKKPTKGKKMTAEEARKIGEAFWKSIEKQ